jgi:antitoxin ChpS
MSVKRAAATRDGRGSFAVRSTLKRAGGSLTMVVPASARDALNLEEGQEMDISVEDGKMVVAAVSTKPRYTLSELLAQCDPDATMSDKTKAWSEAAPVGREIW